MGGNTLGAASRLTNGEYASLVYYIRERLAGVFDPVEPLRSLSTKESHGDLDIICGWRGMGITPGRGSGSGDLLDEKHLRRVREIQLSLTDADLTITSPNSDLRDWCDLLALAVGGIKWVRGGDQISIAVPTSVLHRDADQPVETLQDDSPPTPTTGGSNGSIAATVTSSPAAVTGTTSPSCDDVLVSQMASGLIPRPSIPIGVPDLPTTLDSLTIDPCEAIFHPKHSHTHGRRHTPFYQVDIMLRAPVAIPFALFTSGFGITPILFSSLVRKATEVYGLTVQMSALVLRTRPFPSHRSVDIVLSSDPRAVCRWLGLDYSLWESTTFETTDDLFKWFATIKPGAIGERGLRGIAKRSADTGKRDPRRGVLNDFALWLRNNGWASEQEEGQDETPKPSAEQPTSSTASPASFKSDDVVSSIERDVPVALSAEEDAVLAFWGKRDNYTSQVHVLTVERREAHELIQRNRQRKERNAGRLHLEQEQAAKEAARVQEKEHVVSDTAVVDSEPAK